MIETVLLEYLAAKLDKTSVYFEIPKNPPDTFVILEKTGGGENEKIYSAVFAVQSYAPTLYEAAALNETVKEYMSILEEESEYVSSCTLNSDYNFTDTESKRYRYQAVYNLIHY